MEVPSDRVTSQEDPDSKPLEEEKVLPSTSSSSGLHDFIQNSEDDEPLFPFAAFPNVLHRILTYLDVPSLKKCREVSQLWNEEASRVLASRTDINLPPLFKSPDKNTVKVSLEERLHKYEEITKSLRSKPNLFTNFQVFCPSMRKEICKDFIQSFGTNFKSLKITSEFESVKIMPLVMKAIHEILNESCPNLGTLDVKVKVPKHSWAPKLSGIMDEMNANSDVMNEMREMGESFSIQEPLMFDRPLNITTIKFDGLFTQAVSDFYIRLMKSCPKLISLEFRCFCDLQYSSEYPYFCNLLAELTELLEVTQNLTEFSWRNITDFASHERRLRSNNWEFDEMVIVPVMSEMKFSKKLKTLTIGSSIDAAGRQFLPKFLENVGQFVERLTFTGIYQLEKTNEDSDSKQKKVNEDSSDSDEERNEDRDSEEEKNVVTEDPRDFKGAMDRMDISNFPEMPSVKFLSNQSKWNYGGLLGPKFVAKVFPNLLEYVIEGPDKCKEDEMISWNGTVDDSFLYTLKEDEDICINESLKSLAIYRKVIGEDTIDKCIRFYPNLTDFVIVAGNELMECPPGIRTNRTEPLSKNSPHIFSLIANFKNLKHFTYFYPFPQFFSAIKQLWEGLENIKHFEQLEKLHIVNTETGTHISFQCIKKGLDELAGLTCTLRISGFYMPKHEVADMMRYAKENEIRLEWDGVKEDDNGRDCHLLSPDPTFWEFKNGSSHPTLY